MDAPGPHSGDVARLFCIANDIGAATADWFTRDDLSPLSALLAEVRRSLAMDVAFVSEFVEGRRQFQVVSMSGDSAAAIRAGDSDSLVDTYCKLVADGSLPVVIRDVDDHPAAANLQVTRTLHIKSYLSAVIVLPDGKVFGTLCCFAHAPRGDLKQEHADALRRIADAIAARVAVGV